MAWAAAVGLQLAAAGFENAIEEKVIDSDVIVEIFHVTKRVRGTSDMGMQLRRAVGRQGDVKGIAQRGCLEKAGIASATGRIGLKTIDRPRRQHALEVVDGVAVFAGGYVHWGRGSIAKEAEAS